MRLPDHTASVTLRAWEDTQMYDVAIVGAGMAGMATAARLQAQGLSTVVLESHGQPGGCAGFFRRRDFAFDVGATTLVDFAPGGVGGELLADIGMPLPQGEALLGYVAWLPDRTVTLYRDPASWRVERLDALGDTPRHRRLWHWLDRLAEAFWRASRGGVKLPVQRLGDLWRAVRCVGLPNLPLVRYLHWTVGDALRACGLRDDEPLVGLLAMLLEDTIHAQVDDAPLINGALGVTIRGAGLTRARGGMYGFWRRFVAHYRHLGGRLRVGCAVHRIERLPARAGRGFRLVTRRGAVEAAQVVSAVPILLTARLAPPDVAQALQRYLQRNTRAQGSALVVFLGVPDAEVAGQRFTHHQLLQDYRQHLGNGNNMFVSVSAPGDQESAPPGYRAVMISTHCALEDWEGLSAEAYQRRKAEAGKHLLSLARRVYPDLGQQAVVFEVATPRTYERFTQRPRGAVGGFRQTLDNTNQRAVPYDLGVPGFWLAGDTTWPGLGTVACVLGSRLVAEAVRAAVPRPPARPQGKVGTTPPPGSSVIPCTVTEERHGAAISC
jgi:C-3',4' desaturase CrtD